MTLKKSAKVLLLFLTALVLFIQSAASEAEPDNDFFFLCSGGKTDAVKEHLKIHPGWANARTKDGESCLHLASIPGSYELTKVLLDAGADPNIRTTFSEGLRMHPLSWNVYGGHHKSVSILLEKGADVNADFDYIMMGKNNKKSKQKVTVLDICLQMIGGGKESKVRKFDKTKDTQSEQFFLTRDILLQHGAKMYSEIKGNK